MTNEQIKIEELIHDLLNMPKEMPEDQIVINLFNGFCYDIAKNEWIKFGEEEKAKNEWMKFGKEEK